MERLKVVLRRWHWLHTWSKWEQYEQRYKNYIPGTGVEISQSVESRQRRKCEVCGFMQDQTY